MQDSTVLLEVAGALARVTLNRPERLNAMDLAWIEGLNAVVDRLAESPDVAVVVIRGAGRAFCAGLDLDMLEASGMPPGFYEGQERAFRRLELLEAITIAAIHGYCLGGGVQLAITCDLRVCSSDAVLGLPAVNEGLFPGLAPFRLPHIVGLGTAARLVLSGESIGADEALRLGLTDYVVPAAQFESGLDQIVQTYLSAPRAAVAGSKRLLRGAFTATWEDAYNLSLPLLQACLASDDVAAAREARRQQRRQPRSRP
ncbi:MAG: enoyl-CoA hydratase/isomerase family protein [Chloroflexi bacterium]|nr:enoyl-CoA hydratase/isomerase family protein [Chloroflexota bacterium]